MRRATFLFLGFLAISGTARADLIFSSFDAGNTYNKNSGDNVDGANIFANTSFNEFAAKFVAANSGFLTQIQLGITIPSAPANSTVNVYLYGEASGSPDNASQIFLGSAAATQAFGSTNNSITTISPNLATVSLGSTYWLVLKPLNADTWTIWNTTSTLGQAYFSGDDTNWQSQGATVNLPAFAIFAVPEPSTNMSILLGGSGIVAVVAWRRRRLRAPGK